jgi:DNA-binding MarR family transcriptional regulator
MKQKEVKSEKCAEGIPSGKSEHVKELISKLNKQFESRIRLGIMSVLMVNESMDFVTLKDLLDITDGNLASHLSALEKNGLIEVKKQFIGRKPNTKYMTTPEGKAAFREHLDYLGRLIRDEGRGTSRTMNNEKQ